MKKNKLSERRILIGLICLLFVVTFVHTVGILDLSRNLSNAGANPASQKAQVATLSICLQITPTNNSIEVAEQTGMTNAGGQGIISTYMYWDIKNLCTNDIRIINAGVYNVLNNPTSFSIQSRNSNGTISTVFPTSFTAYNITNYGEATDCTNCGATVNYPATVSYANSTFNTYLIPAGMTKTVRMIGWFTKAHSPQYSLRLLPKSIKWINQSSLNDGTISNGEVLTTSIPSNFANSWASDFVQSWYIQ